MLDIRIEQRVNGGVFEQLKASHRPFTPYFQMWLESLAVMSKEYSLTPLQLIGYLYQVVLPNQPLSLHYDDEFLYYRSKISEPSELLLSFLEDTKDGDYLTDMSVLNLFMRVLVELAPYCYYSIPVLISQLHRIESQLAQSAVITSSGNLPASLLDEGQKVEPQAPRERAKKKPKKIKKTAEKKVKEDSNEKSNQLEVVSETTNTQVVDESVEVVNESSKKEPPKAVRLKDALAANEGASLEELEEKLGVGDVVKTNSLMDVFG